MSIRPVGPGIDSWAALSPLLNEMRDAVIELQNPTRPTALASVVNADLPPADSWRGCCVFVSDKDCIAISTDVAGTYTWLRADGSAI